MFYLCLKNHQKIKMTIRHSLDLLNICAILSKHKTNVIVKRLLQAKTIALAMTNLYIGELNHGTKSIPRNRTNTRTNSKYG